MSKIEIADILEHSPSVRLLGSRNRQFIITFFHYSFTGLEDRSVSFERLFRGLAEYIEVNESSINDDEDEDLKGFENYETRAKNFIRRWISQGFLTNFLDDNGDEFIELSGHSNKVLDWLSTLKKKEFVGAESKFKGIVGQLKDLVENTEEDRKKRLASLKQRQEEIQREIKLIEGGEALFIYEDFQIVSRLDELNQSAKDLLTDFKEVEQNFKEITKSIYQKYANVEQGKDSILSYTFDALEEIKKSDQGRSFYAFYAFLMQNSSQGMWEEMVNKLYHKLEAKNIEYSDLFLRRMSRYLYRAGKDVFAANDKMAEKLSRVISDTERPNNQEMRRLFSDIKTLISRDDIMDTDLEGISLAGKADINLHLERPLNLEMPVVPVYDNSIFVADEDLPESDQLVQLLSKKTINMRDIRRNVKDVLEKQPNITLEKLIEELGGIQLGLGEVLAYMKVIKYFDHKIDETEKIMLEFEAEENKFIELPKITLTDDGPEK